MLTAEKLREIVSYDADSGVFTRLSCFQRPDVLGAIENNQSDNCYARITIDGERHYLHRLAWLYMTGTWPADEIDHINGCRTDNSWRNLRHVSRQANAQNLRNIRANNKSGITGVSWDSARNKWVSRIKVGKTYKLVGRFDSIEESGIAYLAAKRKYHEGCTV